MSKKIIEFSAKLNTGDFEKAFTNLKSRIENISGSYATSRASNQLRERLQGMGLIPPTTQDQNKFVQQENLRKRALAEVEREAQKQFRSAERLERLEEKKKNRLQEMRRIQNVSFEEEIEHKKKIIKLEQDIGRIQELRNSRIMGAGVAADQAQAMRRPGWFTGGDKSWSPGFGIPAVGGIVGSMAGPLLGMAGTGLALSRGVAGIRRYYANQPFEIMAAQGAAATGMANFSGLNSVYSGQGSNFFFGSPERQAAINAANQYAKQMNMSAAIERGAGSAKSGLLSGALSGLPGGSFVGAAAGYASQVLPSIWNSPDKWLAIQAAAGSSTAAGKLDQLELARTFQMAQQAEVAEREKNPLKWRARENYEQNWRSDFDMQRRLGLSDASLFGERIFDQGSGKTTIEGGILSTGLNAGLTREEIMGSMGQILSAGGSTRAARGLGILGAQAGRAGLEGNTNIARLSGLAGDAASTESAFRRLLGEGVKQGLDGSEFRQENNKFQEILAATILTTGFSGEKSINRTADLMGSFVADKTMAGLQGAQSAFSLVDTLTKGNEGVNAQIRGAKIMNNYGYADLGAKSFLQNAGINSITEENPRVQNLFEQAISAGAINISDYGSREEALSAFTSGLRRDVGSSMIVGAETNKIAESLRGQYKELSAQGLPYSEIEKRMGSELGALSNALSLDIGTDRYENLSEQAKRSLNQFTLGGDFGNMGRLLESETGKVSSQLAQGTPSLGQAELEGVARTQKLVNDQFVSMIDAMEKAAESAKKMTSEILETAIKFQQQQNNNSVPQTIPTAGKSR